MTLIAQNVSRFIFALIGVIPFAVASFSVHTDFIAKVTAISDGDTLTVLDSQHQKIKIRLTEIDAPEKAQPFGRMSADASMFEPPDDIAGRNAVACEAA